MQITVNGEPRQIAEGTSVAGLLVQLDLQPRYVAVERNLEIVPRAGHSQCTLQPGDVLEVVTLVGGG